MDRALDEHGANGLAASLRRGAGAASSIDELLPGMLSSRAARDLWEGTGFAYRPRRHEAAMALARVRGMRFDVLPEKPKEDSTSPEEEAKKLEEEARKKALADLWANRRKK